MLLYKLTDKDDRTYGGCQWGEGISHTADGKGPLCTEHWLHAAKHPLLAVLFNPLQGEYDLDTAHLWEGEGEVGEDDSLKVGCTSFTTLRRIDLPVVTLYQRVRWAILCAMEVCREESWLRWANGWLAGKREVKRDYKDKDKDNEFDEFDDTDLKRAWDMAWDTSNLRLAWAIAAARRAIDAAEYLMAIDRVADKMRAKKEVAGMASLAVLAALNAKGDNDIDIIGLAKRAIADSI